MMEDLLQAGVITTTHGIRGEVKVFPTTDDVHRFEDLDSVLLDTGREYMELEIENVKYFKQYAILKFKGIDNINDIEKYKGRSLYVTRDQAIPLEEDEYYIADLMGLDIYLENGEKFGILKDVMETGANDVYIVETEEGKEVLIPAIHECVLDIDIEENRMEIHLMDGLLD
nr:ribosome maturation factor RimM [Blautia pseudococcoides]